MKMTRVKYFIKNKFPYLFVIILKARKIVRDSQCFPAFLSLIRAKRYESLPQLSNNASAIAYVGTVPEEGIAQLAILIHKKCKSWHKLLEIGCGALIAGYPIMQYLNKGNYFGIDPNKWLVENSLQIAEVEKIATQKDARFIYNDRFDATPFNIKFDYVISHSILSHCAHWQLPLLLENVNKCVKSGSKIIVSIRFCEGNRYGSSGYKGTEMDFETWQYPGSSFFRKETIIRLAQRYGYDIYIDSICTQLIMLANSYAVHDWIVLEKKAD
jgi:hypothetical protein